MTDLIPFDFEESPVRIIMLDEAPWFVASDIADILDMRDAADLARMLDDDEKGTHIVRTPGTPQEMTIISESGLYSAIFKSRKPEAKRFRKWVTGTVLPEIRRTGRFELADARPPAQVLADMDTTRFSLALSAVSLMRKLRGPRVALDLWAALGLPQPHGLIESADDLAERLANWIDGQQRFSCEDIARALHLGEVDGIMRRRLGDMLRAMGYELRRARRHGKLGYFWFRGWDAVEA